VLREIKKLALDYDRKPHDLYIEALDLLLRKYGRPSVADLRVATLQRFDVATAQRCNVACPLRPACAKEAPQLERATGPRGTQFKTHPPYHAGFDASAQRRHPASRNRRAPG
jgi:hypothetical protein